MLTSLGKRIFIARKESGMTQDDLAKIAGVARNTISLWESDRYSPDNYSIKKLAEILKKPFEYFLPDDTSEKSNIDLSSVKPASPDNMMTLPVLARIPAGLPEYSAADV